MKPLKPHYELNDTEILQLLEEAKKDYENRAIVEARDTLADIIDKIDNFVSFVIIRGGL